jgi:hypothetical protein
MVTSTAVPADWVTAAKSGIPKHKLEYLRTSGRLIGGDDYRLGPPTNPHASRPEFYYRPTALKQATREVGRPHSDKIRARWASIEQTQTTGDELIILKLAERVAGVDAATIWKWTREGCPHLPGSARLFTQTQRNGRREFRQWSRRQLEEVRRLRTGSPSRPAGDDVYSLDRTAELTGVSRDLLRRRDDRDRLGLVATFPRVLVGTRNSGGNALRRSTEKVAGRLAFTRASVDAYVTRHGPPCVPADMMTLSAAGEALGIAPATVKDWALAGILRGNPRSKIPGGTKPGWLIDRASVREVADLIQQKGIKLKHGSTALRNALREARKKSPHSPAETKGRQPKRRDPAVVKVQAFCYDHSAAGDPWGKVAFDAQREFPIEGGFSPPTDRAAACVLAKRHATRNRLPWPPKSGR